MSFSKFTVVTLFLILLSAVRTYAEEGKRVPFADPFILYEDGVYYMYGTSSDDGIAVMVSDNLTDWCVPYGDELYFALSENDSYGNHWFWAPEVYHVGDKYYMYYSSETHICAAVSDSPLGPFVQKEKEPMLQEQGIDNSLFIDIDGTPYIFWVRFNNGNEIWSAELEKDLLTIKPGTEKFCIKMDQDWEKIWPAVNEGPAVLYHKGRYYLTYSANSYESQDYAIGYATADMIGGEWKKYEGNPVFHKPAGLVGVGHHAFFKDKRNRNRIVFHSHFNKGCIHPRVVHISEWNINRKGVLNIDRDRIITPHCTKSGDGAQFGKMKKNNL